MEPAKQSQNAATEGLFFGLLGVLGFSLTLPATRLAVVSLDPVIVGLGRALVAAALAAPLLLVTKQEIPERRHWWGLLLVMIGVIIGFPMLTAIAMRYVPSSHGAVVLGLLPFATALAGTFRANERPSKLFWLASALGSIAVVVYALSTGGGDFYYADGVLLGAVLLAALGYAEGARLARDIGGWQVICWALLASVPIVIGPVSFKVWQQGFAAAPSAYLGFAYVSVVSMFLAFFAWYHGLAVGGVARVSQLQLLQPFLTLGFAKLFLDEQFGVEALLAVLVVVVSIVLSKRCQIR